MTFAVPRSIPIFITALNATPGGAFARAGDRQGGSGLGGRATAGPPSRAISGHVGRTGDARTQLLELPVDVLIPPLNVMRAVDQRGALGRQRAEDQRRAGAQVGDVRLAAAQGRRAEVLGVGRALDLHPFAELAQLGEPLEPVLEDRLV